MNLEGIVQNGNPNDEQEAPDGPIEALEIFDPDKINEEVTPFRYSITSYGADYTVDGLVSRLQKKDIFVPYFQRRYVWKHKQASQFIESLLLGLPVPGVFMAKEHETKKHLVIDGQQRLLTLEMFVKGVFAPLGREFKLIEVQERYLGRTYSTLEEEDRRALDDSVIHATIIRQDEPSEDDSSIHQVFERLNTGGSLLTDQEIRVSVSHGGFVELLHNLNDHAGWRDLIGTKSSRLRDEELILRFLALYLEADKYETPMKRYLNTFLATNKEFQKYAKDVIESLFVGAANAVFEMLGSKAFRPTGRLNAAVVDSLMVGLARRLAQGGAVDKAKVAEAAAILFENPEYVEAIQKSTAHADNLAKRLNLATMAFEAV
jgi:uncharacterized protein with ParB-like and HNH nuclease domain